LIWEREEEEKKEFTLIFYKLWLKSEKQDTSHNSIQALLQASPD
jgi:hypothetical protein